ncbi:MAG: PEP/pyruvate-binding domain-containing protein [Candidatus Nanoarchaeia archaeon]
MHVKVFKDISKEDVLLAGGKGASLGELTKVDVVVPEGFIILSSAFDEFLNQNNLSKEITTILNSIYEEKSDAKLASAEIRKILLKHKISESLEQEILVAFTKLNSIYVAIRSSATVEDGDKASWAGQLESFLNTDKTNLIENIKKCWVSLFTKRAISYMIEKHVENEKFSVAVVVQKMINSEVAGVAFSMHPVTLEKDKIVVEAGLGLGEAVVSGEITPDTYIVDKNTLKIIDKKISKQDKQMLRAANGNNEWVSVMKNNEQKLSSEQILELSNIILKIERHYGFPCDIEWALENKKLYILQSRPITTN